MSTALAKREETSLLDTRSAIAPRSVNELMAVADTVAKSGLYGVKSKEEAFVRIATGVELGLSAMQSLRGVYVMNGRPTLAADLMVGVCKSSPVCEYFKLVESSDKIATYETSRVGEGLTRISYTIDQAKRAKLAAKDTWTSHTEAMLRARASSIMARAVYSDLLNGLYTPEEVAEFDKAPPQQYVEVPSEALTAAVANLENCLNSKDMAAAKDVELSHTEKQEYVKAWNARRAVLVEAAKKKATESQPEVTQ